MTHEQVMMTEHWNPDAWYVHVADWLGWSEPGFVIALSVPIILIGSIFLWQSIFMMFLVGAAEMRQWSREAKGFMSFVWWMGFAAFAICAFAMELVISIIAIWVGYTAMRQFRDWWHKENRR